MATGARMPSSVQMRREMCIRDRTGITDELLREEGIGKQAFAELLAALLTPGTMLAAYNAQFDLLFLYAFLQKYGDARLLQDLSLIHI